MQGPGEYCTVLQESVRALFLVSSDGIYSYIAFQHYTGWLLISRSRIPDSQLYLSPGLKTFKTDVNLFVFTEYNFGRKETPILYFLLFLDSVYPWAGTCGLCELIFKFFFLLVYIYMEEDKSQLKNRIFKRFWQRLPTGIRYLSYEEVACCCSMCKPCHG